MSQLPSRQCFSGSVLEEVQSRKQLNLDLELFISQTNFEQVENAQLLKRDARAKTKAAASAELDRTVPFSLDGKL